MPLRDIIKEKVHACSKETSVLDVADLMKKKDIGAVLVVEDGRPIGIVTDRDIAVRCIADRVDFSIPVHRIMTATPVVIDENKGLQDVIVLMKKHQVRRIPVVDPSGQAIGLISFGDVFGLIAKEMSDLSYDTPVIAAA
ncbi:MAG: CBS domain-containing protein [Bdellovibrionota bacterium]